jgi:hypothetical protein
MAKRLRIGDVVEIQTRTGLFYAQYTHSNPEYGTLIRVLNGVFPDRPQDIQSLGLSPTRYFLFCFLQSAVNRGVWEVIGNCPLPEHSKHFPLFRSGIADPVTGSVKDWWLWDGNTSWKVGALSKEQRSLPERGIWTDALLIERLEEGWNPDGR